MNPLVMSKPRKLITGYNFFFYLSGRKLGNFKVIEKVIKPDNKYRKER